MKLLIGTHNPAKQQDMIRSFSVEGASQDMQFDFLLPKDLSISSDADETGTTFEENSKIKAKFFYKASLMPTVGDDGGIMIAELNNEPGVYTRRWIGHDNATDEEIIQYVLKRMAHLKGEEQRRTVFATCVTYFDGTNFFQESGRTEGYIAEKALTNYKSNGFPMRALFVHKNGKYYDELTPEEHEMYNHRDKAVKLLVAKIKHVID
ncbi:non-canonical purine NTP pyrophosphatase [Candidatus Woesebacteria bacterium]|nr:non-canonical purine NTP pyrophosphatase [Candidatus Woesebacteria bacterium]